MPGVQIAKLSQISRNDLRRLVSGYTSEEKYLVQKTEDGRGVQITLELAPLERPFVKRFGQDRELEGHYDEVLAQGLSLGAYDGSRLVGLAIAEERQWNKTLWLWELHVVADYQGQGIGIKLVHGLVKLAQQRGCRVIACETQNTNVPAIRFYRKLGFEIDGIDLSYYTNSDITDYEVALFMKKKL
jgi:ribosomal protein S18 acetylase RimI-like enzyme